MGFINKLESAAVSNIGTRETNQDRMFSKTTESYGLFCIADGMGGLQEGEYAASVVVDTLDAWWNKMLDGSIAPKGAEVLDAFFDIFKTINNNIRQHAKEAKAHHGTTCSLLMIQDEKYYIAHAGDSRIYKQESKLFAKLNQLTEDHAHPESGKLTSCLGAFAQPKIFTRSGTIEKPCSFLLCSDGLYRVVQESKLSAAIRTHKECGKAADKLVNYALKNGARDNVSVVVVKVN